MKTLPAPEKAFIKQALLVLLLMVPVSVLTVFLQERAWIIILPLGAGLAWFGRKNIRDAAAALTQARSAA